MTVAGLAPRIRSIERAITQRRGRTELIQDYEFSLSPTCPPSTSVIIRGGKAWRNAVYWFVIGYNVEKPTITVDIATERMVQDQRTSPPVLDLSFNNPYYYKALIFMYWGDWVFYEQYCTPGTLDWVTNECRFSYLAADVEYATSQEAEAKIDSLMNGELCGGRYGGGLYYEYAFPLAGLVLRNNGVTGLAGQIMEIDKLNRQRSYIYRDLRTTKNWITA